MNIIAKNITSNAIRIFDLSDQYVAPNSQVELLDQNSIESITNSNHLKQLINDGIIVINDGTSDLIIENSIKHVTLATLWSISSSSSNRQFIWRINQGSSNAVTSGTFFKTNEGSNSTGSWSGYATNNISPLVIPYDCKLSEVVIRLKGTSFNWLSTPGTIFFDLGFLSMNYNGSIDLNTFTMNLSGTYSGGSFDNQSHLSIIDIFTMTVGSNLFSKGNLISSMFKTDSSGAGRVNTLRRPYLSLTFEEV